MCQYLKCGFVCVLQEFFKELEGRSAQKASAESAGAQILQLTDSEVPGLHRQLAQLEQEWTNLSNILPTLRQTQQQVRLMSLSLSLFFSLPLSYPLSIWSKALANRYCLSKHPLVLLLAVDKPVSQSDLGQLDLLARTCRGTTGRWKLGGPLCPRFLWAV